MRLAVVSASLAVGGAERVVAGLATHWAGRGHAVTLITLAPTGSDFYPVAPDVRRVGLDLLAPSTWIGQALRRGVRRVSRLRRALRDAQPDVIVGLVDQTNVLMLVAGAGLGVPIVVSERVDPRHYAIGWIWSALRRVFYRRAALLVVQTEAVRPWAESVTRADRVRVIPNAVRISATSPAEERAREPMVLAMGRFVRQKRFDVVLDAFGLASHAEPTWSLEILGDGPLREALMARAASAGLADRVRLPGVVAAPEETLRRAGIFVLSSDFEGFPNALVEAMACGCAVVATDCPSGPGEIVRHGEDGILVPPGDPAAMAEALGRLMADPELRRRMGGRAREAARRFAVEAVMPRWDACLDEARARRP